MVLIIESNTLREQTVIRQSLVIRLFRQLIELVIRAPSAD